MAQWVKHFLCKCERHEFGSPRTRVKRSVRRHTSMALALGRRRRLERLWASGQNMGAPDRGDPVSKNKTEQSGRMNDVNFSNCHHHSYVSDTCTCTHTCSRACEHLNTHRHIHTHPRMHSQFKRLEAVRRRIVSCVLSVRIGAVRHLTKL